MNLLKIENAGKSLFMQFPVIKKSIKRAYQVACYVLSNDKIKSEGDMFCVSPIDDYEYFFGYYDKSPWDMTDRYMICLRVKQAYKSVAPEESADILLIDIQNENSVKKIATTNAWNVQQGCVAQWLGPDFSERIIYNDFREGKFCSVIFNVKKYAEEKTLPMPVYDVAKNGIFALSLDFIRLHRLRPGYGYSNLSDLTKNEICPDKTCIWKINLQTGKVTDLLKYTDFADFESRPEMMRAEHKINHLMINPDGTRFMVLHRWFQKGRKYTRLVTVNSAGTDLYNLSDENFASHSYWKNNDEILSFLRKNEAGEHYYLLKDKTRNYTVLWNALNTDGHCSYSADGSSIVTDTYPNRKRIASVFICNEPNNTYRPIARVFAPFRYDNDVRCDLHPRWNWKGDKICIDSAHEGKRRLYVINL
jgi:Tol biopolymer transport system component